MIKLEVKKQDNSIHWTEIFETQEQAEAWIAEEKTRPYFDNGHWEDPITKTNWVEGWTHTFEDVTPAVDQTIIDVGVKYDEMTKAVYDQMFTVFYTRKSDSAIANYEMWKHMKDNPALYSSQGLKAEYQLDNADTTELFSPGSALDTDQKIIDYATRKLEQADEYVVWRSTRIQQFRNEKEAILNP